MVVSTELTLIKELDLLDIAGHTMMYMVEHPQRKWISMVGGVMITSDAAHWKETNPVREASGDPTGSKSCDRTVEEHIPKHHGINGIYQERKWKASVHGYGEVLSKITG